MLAIALLSIVASATPLTLEQAWERARVNSPRLRAAVADVDVAVAEADVAGRWLLDPTLEIAGATDALTTGRGERDLDVHLQQSLRWPMETWARHASAKALVDAASNDRRRAEVVAWRELAVAYGTLAAALDELALREALLEIARRTNDAAVRRAASGASAPIEASFAAVDVAAANSAVLQTQANVGAATAALCRELGDDSCADVAVVWPTVAVPTVSDDALLAMIEARPDVEAARGRVIAAQARQDAAGWQRVPAPTLGVTASLQRAEFNAVVDDNTLLGLGVSLPLPVFSLGQGSVAVATAHRARQEAERDAIRLRALHETRAAMQVWQASVRARATWQEVEPRFEESLRWLTEGYDAAAIGLDAMLTGRDRIVRARLESIAVRRAELTAAADVFVALGHLPAGASP